MQLTPFLMFTGAAEEAMTFYLSLFPNSRVLSLEKYGAEGPGKAGSVKHARFELNGLRLACIDSPAVHGFTFTASTSLFVDLDSRAQFDEVFARLSDGGKLFMPPGAYGFSQWFAWVEDRFGFAWQLNLP